MSVFAKNLSELTSERGARTSLAKYLGELPQTVSNWCTGKAIPSVNKVADVADYFGISVDALLGLESEPDVQYMARYTGLSVGDIERLHNIKCFGFTNMTISIKAEIEL